MSILFKCKHNLLFIDLLSNSYANLINPIDIGFCNLPEPKNSSKLHILYVNLQKSTVCRMKLRGRFYGLCVQDRALWVLCINKVMSTFFDKIVKVKTKQLSEP